MRITVLGCLIVIGTISLLALLTYRLGQEINKRTGNDNELPNNAQPNDLS
jgi:hypothetical protein